MPNLTIRRTWPDDPMGENDYAVYLDGKKSLARIRLETTADYRRVWKWSIYGFNTRGQNGEADTFDGAKRQLKEQILRLLADNAPLMPDPPEWKPGSAFTLT